MSFILFTCCLFIDLSIYYNTVGAMWLEVLFRQTFRVSTNMENLELSGNFNIEISGNIMDIFVDIYYSSEAYFQIFNQLEIGLCESSL